MKYWPYYCEENVWHLCHELPETDVHSLVAFISNASQSVAMWCQRAAIGVEAPILWDYHVILLRADAGGWRVVDPDSTLGPAVEPAAYLDASFRSLPSGRESLAPRFRLVPAQTLRFALHTDRRHMQTVDGGWQAEPPPWPVIGEGSNLARFASMDETFIGRMVDLAELRALLASSPR